MKWKIFSCFIATLIAFSCSKKTDVDPSAVARVGENILTIHDVEKNIPPGLPVGDSTLMATNYINNWVEEQAVMLEALKAIDDTKEIERLVDDYRRELILLEYRKLMSKMNPQQVPDDNQIKDYYDNHQANFILQRPLIKGVYIKIDADTPQTDNIRKLYRSDDPADIDSLERLVLTAVNYEYFRDRWTDWGQLEARIPSKELDIDPDRFIREKNHLETTADGYTYFLYITEHLDKGSRMPIEYARDRIVDALDRERAITLDKEMRQQLVRQAFESGDAEIFSPTTQQESR